MSTESIQEQQKAFWNEYNNEHQLIRKNAWQELKSQYFRSLLVSVIYRLGVSFVVMPAVILFGFFVLESMQEGLIATMNGIFIGHTTPFTQSDASPVYYAWGLVGLLFFGLTWLYSFRSPVDSAVSSKMDEWFDENKDRLPL